LVVRDAAQENAASGERRWFADNVDTLIMVLAIAAAIIGYTVFGILAVAGR
jgi:hypothetical protein